MEFSECKEVHDKIVIGDDWIGAANLVLKMLGKKPSVTNKPQAVSVCRGLFQFLLDQDMYLHAATLQWGSDVFNAEPESVRRSFEAIHKGNMILVMGGSSLGKTYGIGAWMLLDYLRDPMFTTVKLAAVSEDHLRKNLYAHLKSLYQNCAIPSQYNIEMRDSDLWMGVKEAGYEFGISGIAFKQSQETSGQFKGHKFKPVRKVPHPKFGYFSRLRVLGDEGQNWPGGPFQDFNSLVASMDGPDKIKIAVAFNPENTSCNVVRMSEPEQGWQVEDMETLYDYTSRSGWMVCRLDAAKCENVIQKKVVYPGLQTYTGFLSYLKAGGDSSAAYQCFARGWPPMKGSINIIIPPAWPQSQRGEATFVENPITLASVDLAFTGQDTAQMCVGRWGLASGWRDHMGKTTYFTDRINVAQRKPRHVLQIDQIMPMNKHDDTVKMSEEIMGRAKMLQISPEWVAVDATGYGFGVASHLKKVWGGIFGIGWAEKATAAKIVAEDVGGADEQCSGVMSEMWWAFRRWLDPACCAILINPIIPPQPINTQLTSRRYRNGKAGKIVVESKEEYKARNQKSPDEADSMIMLTHLVRRKSDVLPGLVEQQIPVKTEDGGIKFQSASRAISMDQPDSIMSDGTENDHLEDAIAE